jgi:hypothetical protein
MLIALRFVRGWLKRSRVGASARLKIDFSGAIERAIAIDARRASSRRARWRGARLEARREARAKNIRAPSKKVLPKLTRFVQMIAMSFSMQTSLALSLVRQRSCARRCSLEFVSESA